MSLGVFSSDFACVSTWACDVVFFAACHVLGIMLIFICQVSLPV